MVIASTLLAALVFLAGCQRAVSKPDPEPEPPAAALLQGSWRVSGVWDDDGVVLGSWVQTLTFTASRWVDVRAYIYADTGLPESPWPDREQGSWSATDDTITMSWYDAGDDEVYGRPGMLREFTLRYVWAKR